MPPASNRRNTSWHLSKEVPIALILTVFTSIMSGVYIASKLDSRVDTLEKATAKAEIAASVSEAKLDAKLSQMLGAITSLDTKIMQGQIDLARNAGKP